MPRGIPQIIFEKLIAPKFLVLDGIVFSYFQDIPIFNLAKVQICWDPVRQSVTSMFPNACFFTIFRKNNKCLTIHIFLNI